MPCGDKPFGGINSRSAQADPIKGSDLDPLQDIAIKPLQACKARIGSGNLQTVGEGNIKLARGANGNDTFVDAPVFAAGLGDDTYPVWNDTQPIWRQVKDQLINQILDGTLRNGEAIPSVRQCASDLQLNPLTVARAYQELVDEGVLEKRRGQGSVVCEGTVEHLKQQERERFLQDEWPQVKARMARLGLDPNKLP